MAKRILTICIMLSVLFSSVSFAASAASEEEEQRIRDQITSVYWQTLASSGRSSLHGFCGVMAGWELYHLGVTETAVTHNGNEMYDMLRRSDKIIEGYSAQCYDSGDYTIEEALNTITHGGTRDAYNIMVGFQRTRTAAGSLYGHVTVIHAVLNGNVYFTEGFMTPFQPEPSQAMVCTIAEFAEYYDSWATFEGMIYFGDGSRIAGCDTYDCDLYGAGTEPVAILSAPDLENGQTVRVAAAGERLRVNALCQNAQDELFYRITEGTEEFFVKADLMKPVWFLSDDVNVSDIQLPIQVDRGEDAWISGVIRSGSTIVSGILEITDASGNVVVSCEIPKESNMLDLGKDAVNTRIDTSRLADGHYTYGVYCDLRSRYCENGDFADHIQRVLVAESDFLVGNAVPDEMSKNVILPRSIPKISPDGWQYEDDCWYYYENGAPRTGWFCYEGVDYYFLPDGSAATGWHNINGRDRWFSDTGAMRIGWLETEEGTYYMLSNGVAAIGTLEIDGTTYTFDEMGKLLA